MVTHQENAQQRLDTGRRQSARCCVQQWCLGIQYSLDALQGGWFRGVRTGERVQGASQRQPNSRRQHSEGLSLGLCLIDEQQQQCLLLSTARTW